MLLFNSQLLGIFGHLDIVEFGYIDPKEPEELELFWVNVGIEPVIKQYKLLPAILQVHMVALLLVLSVCCLGAHRNAHGRT